MARGASEEGRLIVYVGSFTDDTPRGVSFRQQRAAASCYGRAAMQPARRRLSCLRSATTSSPFIARRERAVVGVPPPLPLRSSVHRGVPAAAAPATCPAYSWCSPPPAPPHPLPPSPHVLRRRPTRAPSTCSALVIVCSSCLDFANFNSSVEFYYSCRQGSPRKRLRLLTFCRQRPRRPGLRGTDLHPADLPGWRGGGGGRVGALPAARRGELRRAGPRRAVLRCSPLPLCDHLRCSPGAYCWHP